MYNMEWTGICKQQFDTGLIVLRKLQKLLIYDNFPMRLDILWGIPIFGQTHIE